MKLEIVEEKTFNEGTWYSLRVDGKSFQYSKKLEEIEELYQKIKNDPSVLNEQKNVLKSEEI